MHPRFVRVDFGGESESAVLPLGLPCPAFLQTSDVNARRVDFIVALGLEIIEMLDVLVKVGNSRAGFLIGSFGLLVHVSSMVTLWLHSDFWLTKCHESEDDSVLWVLSYERHVEGTVRRAGFDGHWTSRCR